MVKESKTRDNANFVIYGNQFTIGDVMAALIFEISRKDVSFFFENRANKHTFVKDLVIYEENGEKFYCSRSIGEMRENGIRIGVAGRMWRKYAAKITKNTSNPKLVEVLVDKGLIQWIDAEENASLVNIPQEAKVGKILNSCRRNWEREGYGTGKIFQKSIDFMRPIFASTLTEAGFDIKKQVSNQAV